MEECDAVDRFIRGPELVTSQNLCRAYKARLTDIDSPALRQAHCSMEPS